MGITESLAVFGTHVIQAVGYVGLFLLMVAESMVIPIPSEAVMPFAGFSIAENAMSWPLVIIVATAGSVVGSLIGYGIGRWGGRPFVNRFGKYVLIDHEDLDWTDAFFNRRGNITILISRFIPVVRHLISIPAGISRMRLLPFVLFTLAGAGIWDSFLTLAGYLLRTHWNTILHYSHILDILVVALIVAALAWYIWRHLRKRRRRGAGEKLTGDGSSESAP